MSGNMIGTCEVCQKPVPRDCMTYVDPKLYHPDCFEKIKNTIPTDQVTIANQELKDQLERELHGLKIQLAQLKNLAVRNHMKKSRSSKSTKRKSSKKKKRKSTKKKTKRKRATTKRKRATTKRRKKSTSRKPVRKSRVKSKRKTRRKAVRRVSRRKKKAKRRR